MAKKAMDGVQLAYKARLLGFFETGLPYEKRGRREVMERARELSSKQLGTITVTFTWEATFPTMQGIIVSTDPLNGERRVFDQAISRLFPGRKIEMRWVNLMWRGDDRQLLTLLVKKYGPHSS